MTGGGEAFAEQGRERARAVAGHKERAEEQVREAAMTPFAIAVLLTILAMPKLAALIAIYTLAVADPVKDTVVILSELTP